MSDLFWLSDAQMARLKPYFPKPHGKPRVDDRRVLSGIIFINRNDFRWRDAPKEYGPHKTLYNRWKRWSDKGVFARIMAGLAADPAGNRSCPLDHREGFALADRCLLPRRRSTQPKENRGPSHKSWLRLTNAAGAHPFAP